MVKKEKVGLLGGSFNPIHNGHLIIAEQVFQKLKLDKLYFMPSNQPPHVDAKHVIPSSLRLEMLQLAIESNPNFDIEPIELERTGKSYTIDTVELLKARYPQREYYFIIGADMVEYLPKWRSADRISEFVQFVGVQRPGYTLETSYPIIEVEVPEIDISSSTIRSMIKRGDSIRYLVPDSVRNEIEKKGIYLENNKISE